MTLTSHRVITDIFNLENVVQHTCMMQGKNIIIDTLRDIFRADREYKYVDDVFGYPKTPSHLGLDPEAGLDGEETTRIYIGSSYRYDVKFNPSIIVKNTGNRYKPISFNQDWMSITHSKELIVDGYGKQTIINTPEATTLVGAWDQTFEVKVVAETEMDREEIADIVIISLVASRRKELEQAGIFIKNLSTGGEAEQPYANDYLYTVSVNLEIRSEWKILIPISNIMERIAMCITFDALDTDPPADGLTINQHITLADQLS